MPLQDVPREPLARVVVADDVGRRPEYLIPAGVVVVEVRVDQERDRLARDRLDLPHHRAGRLRRNVRVDDQHIVPIDDDGGVRADVHRTCTERAIDAGRDLRERVGGRGRGRLRAERCGPKREL